VIDTYDKLCSIEDETGNVKQITSPETGNSLGKLVTDTSGNVYSPDEKSNCPYSFGHCVVCSSSINGF
jgi:hypothetical protein